MTLKSKAICGVKWTTYSTVVLTIFQLLQLAVLARFLDPSAFGLMALVMVAIGFLQAFADMGISNAIIHKQTISHEQLSSLYWLNIFSGVFIYSILFVISGQIAIFYSESSLEILLKIVGVNFIILALGNQYRVLLQKKLEFNLIAKIEIISTILSTILAIYLAVNNFGVYSLVWGYIVNTTIATILLVVFGLKIHKPLLYFNYTEIKDFISFGLFQMGEKSINYISANIDKMIIGKILGMEALGYYNLAWQLVVFPLMKINPIITKVLFPVLSKVQHSIKKTNYFYIDSTYILMIVNAPLLLGLIATSTEVVHLMYGSNWNQVVILVNILALVGLFKSFGNTGGAILLAKGRADIGFWWNLMWAISMTLLILTFLYYFKTIESVAYAQLVGAFTVGLIWHYIIIKIGNINYILVLKKSYKPVLYGLIMCGVISLLNYIDLNQNTVFVLKVLFGALIYFIFIKLFEMKKLKKIIRGI